MGKLEKAKRLKDMLSQVAPNHALENLIPQRGGGGLEGLRPTDEAQAKIESGLEKLATDRHQDLSDAEMFGPRGHSHEGRPTGRLRASRNLRSLARRPLG